MATMLYRKQRAEIGFTGSMTTILTCDKKRENRPRKVEDCQLQALLDEDDTQSQKMLAGQLGVSQAAISCGYMPWGRFKRSENGCHMN